MILLTLIFFNFIINIINVFSLSLRGLHIQKSAIYLLDKYYLHIRCYRYIHFTTRYKIPLKISTFTKYFSLSFGYKVQYTAHYALKIQDTKCKNISMLFIFKTYKYIIVIIILENFKIILIASLSIGLTYAKNKILSRLFLKMFHTFVVYYT